MRNQTGVAFALLVLILGFTACRSVQDLQTPRLKTTSLLSVSAEEQTLLTLHMKIHLARMKQMDYASLVPVPIQSSQQKQEYLERNRFLEFLACTDQHLGRLEAYEASHLQFFKESKGGSLPRYVVYVPTQRQRLAKGEEQFILAPAVTEKGMGYRWVGYYVKAPQATAFHQCVSHLD
jgi:hypothetical protein